MMYLNAVLLCLSVLCFSNSEGKFTVKDDYQYYSGLQVQLKLHRAPADFQTARMKCHDEGAILAAPWSDQFWLFLLQHVTAPDDLTIYAGVQEYFPEGIYTNNSGKLMLSRKLQDTIDLARCVVYHSNGTRKLVNCKDPYVYVCQAPVAETLGCEGFSRHDTDFKLENTTGSCYKFNNTYMTWYEAYKTCQEEGAHLAIINSIKEADILKKMFEKTSRELNNYYSRVNYQAIAVGFYYWKETDTYMTIQGESIEQAGYVKWNNNHAPSQGGGIMYLNGTLGQIDPSRRVPFICEKTPVLQKTKYPLWFF